MKTIKLWGLSLLFVLPTMLMAQRPEVISGDIANLFGVDKINVKFDYSEWTFYNERIPEKEYVAKRIEDISADKGAAEGEVWHKDWLKTRNTEIPNFLISGLNDGIRDEINFGMNMKDAKYTLTVKILWTYPGYFAVAMNQPAKASTKFIFTKNDAPNTPILVISEEKVRGANKGIFTAANNNNRIAIPFNTTGAYVGKELRKKLKKVAKDRK